MPNRTWEFHWIIEFGTILIWSHNLCVRFFLRLNVSIQLNWLFVNSMNCNVRIMHCCLPLSLSFQWVSLLQFGPWAFGRFDGFIWFDCFMWVALEANYDANKNQLKSPSHKQSDFNPSIVIAKIKFAEFRFDCFMQLKNKKTTIVILSSDEKRQINIWHVVVISIFFSSFVWPIKDTYFGHNVTYFFFFAIFRGQKIDSIRSHK